VLDEPVAEEELVLDWPGWGDDQVQMVGEVCVVRDSSEETPFDEACVDLLIPRGSETMTKCVGVIERVDGGHHVNDGLCAEPGDGGASVVLKFVGDVAKNRPQALAFA